MNPAQPVLDAARLAQATQAALIVAREAGALVLKGYRSRPSYERKQSYADLVTEHDLASERLIRQRLAELTPDIAIVGEEQGGTPSDAPTWYVDPIDGTVNFAHGHPFFAVSLGLLDHGHAVAGVIVAPALGVEWHGFVGDSKLGAGCFRNGQACGVSPTSVLSDGLIATGFSPLMRQHGHPEDNVKAFERVMPEVRDLRRAGSAALDLVLVADGTYDAYWERRLGPWDLMAGVALVQAAGGRITSLTGGKADLSRGYLLASNGHLHDALLPLLSADGEPTVSSG